MLGAVWTQCNRQPLLYQVNACTFRKAHSGAGLVKAGKFLLVSGVSIELGRKNQSGDRDLVCSAPGGTHQSGSYGGQNAGFVHSNTRVWRHLRWSPCRTPAQQTPFPERREDVFLQLDILLEPHFTCCDFRKSVTTADLGWFLLDLTEEVHLKGSRGGKVRALCKKSDTDHCAPHWKGSIKGSTKTVKVRTENEIWTRIDFPILMKLHSSWPEKVISSTVIFVCLRLPFFPLYWFCFLSVVIVKCNNFGIAHTLKGEFSDKIWDLGWRRSSTGNYLEKLWYKTVKNKKM